MQPPHVSKVRSYRVLLVEDDRVTRETLKELLEEGIWNLEVDTAPSAEAALGLLAPGRYDLLMTDQHLGGLTGLGLLAWVQREHPTMGRVLVTASTDLGLADQLGAEAPVHGYVQKPYSARSLVALVRALLYAPPDQRGRVTRREVQTKMARGRAGALLLRAAEARASPVGGAPPTR